MPGVFKTLNSEKGTVLVELVAACMVLIVFFFATVEMMWIIRDGVYLQRIAREAAREAVLTKDLDAGYAVANANARAYFGSYAGSVRVTLTKTSSGQEHRVVCFVSYPHRFFGWFSKDMLGGKGVTLSAKAVFGWQDA